MDGREANDAAIGWLLQSDEPAVCYRARTWLLGQPETDSAVQRDRERSWAGPIVTTLLDFPDPKVNPYRKYSGLHWRIVSLADFALPLDAAPQATRHRLQEGIERELTWAANPRSLDALQRRRPDGLYLADASIEGNALYAASRFGHATDEGARRLVDALLRWQWPDGGWNCDRRASGYRSSFHESWATAIGLAAYHDATGDAEALAAARRTAGLLLSHHLTRSLDGRRALHSSMSKLHWPAYWHYDLLAGLRVLRAVDPALLRDPRAAQALQLLASRQLPDGRFQTDTAWWQAPTRPTSPTDVIDWGRSRPSEVLTLQALAVLASSAGRPARERPVAPALASPD